MKHRAIFASLLACTVFAPPRSDAADAWAQIQALIAQTPQIKKVAPPNYQGAADHTWYEVEGGSSSGFAVRADSFAGTLANGQTVYVTPLDTGGSGGEFMALLWTTYGGRTRFVGDIPTQAGGLRIALQSGALVVKTPVYGPNDAMCCPSAIRTERDTLQGIKLVKLSVTTQSAH